MSKNFLLRLLIVLTIPLSSLIGLPSSHVVAEKFKFATSARQNPLYNLPILAAEDQGYWKQQGLDVQYVPFTGGARMHQALVAGEVDMAISGATSEIQAASRGVPVTIVADLKAHNDYVVAVVRDSPIKEGKDLKGAKIGINRFGGEAHGFGRALAKILGMERDIKFMALGGVTEEIAAMKRGLLDGRISGVFAAFPLIFTGEIRSVAKISDYLPKEWIDVVISARRDVIQKRPEEARATVRAAFQGRNYVRENRQWTIEKLRSFYQFPDDMARALYPELRYAREGSISKKAVENVVNFLVEMGIVPKEKAYPVEQFYASELFYK